MKSVPYQSIEEPPASRLTPTPWPNPSSQAVLIRGQSSADFVSLYATTHPVEDWAETFATNMMVDAGYPISGDWATFNNTTTQTVADSSDKMDLLDNFFAGF